MSEAEKKWYKWIESTAQLKWETDCDDYPKSDETVVIDSFSDGVSTGIEAYKAALRREIDREKAEALLSKNYSPKTLQTLDKVLELLDTVEP